MLNLNIKGIGAYVFIVYYKKENKKFYLRAHRDKANNGLSLLMIKLDSHYVLQKKEILMIGDIYFQVQTSDKRLEIVRLASKASPENK